MGKTDRLTRLLVDKETGEVVEEKPLPKRWIGEPYFVKVYRMSLSEIIKNTDLSPHDIRILFFMVSEMREKTNEVLLYPQDIIRTLRMSPSKVYEGIAKLRNLGLVIRKGHGQYLVSDEVAYRGRKEYISVEGKHAKGLLE